MLPRHTDTQSAGKSHHCQFSAEFPHKLSFCIRGQVVCCAAVKAIITQVNVNICVQRNELRRGADAVASLLYESIFAGYVQILVFIGCHWRSWRFMIVTSSD
jgi:hypothetical protein